MTRVVVDPAENLQRQLLFGLPCAADGLSIGWLDDNGVVSSGSPEKTWLTCRMAHVFALGSILNGTKLGAVVPVALESLSTRLRDDVYGGWFDDDRHGTERASKFCYVHAHVVIGAAAAARAGFGDALDLRDNAVLQLERFWRPLEGLYADELSRDWSVEQPTRSSTANMHVLEALLALAQNPPTGYEARHFLDRAESIVTRLIHHMARDNDWRIPQRFDAGGQVDLQSGSEHPDDPFDPFGNVVGLDLEWARLILGLRELLGDSAPVWILDAARALYSRAIADGWSAHDGGFVYTTDWHGSPLVRLRMHWVLAEAISAAATLATATGDDRYRADLDRWWQFAADHVIDPSNGSWRHELDARNQPSAVVWQGRPDLYHSAHAALFATGAHGATPLDAAINSRLAQ